MVTMMMMMMMMDGKKQSNKQFEIATIKPATTIFGELCLSVFHPLLID
jgi:hypothetical protein